MSVAKPLKHKESYSSSRAKVVVRWTESTDPGGKKRAVGVLRVADWFEDLRRRTDRISAYAVGKRVTPDTYIDGSDGVAAMHHNQWAKYGRGSRLPEKDTLALAEKAYPGSSRRLTAAAWDILELDSPLGDREVPLLRTLSLDVQEAVFVRASLKGAQEPKRRPLPQVLRSLHCVAGLDALAALVVMLRAAHEGKRTDEAFAIGRALHSVLLIAATRRPCLMIASELFEFFRLAIFPMANTDAISFDLDLDEFLAQRNIVCAMKSGLDDTGRFEAELETTRLEADVLAGRFGDDLRYGLAAHWVSVPCAAGADNESAAFVSAMRTARYWGLDVLLTGRRERALPPEIQVALLAASRPGSTQSPWHMEPDHAIKSSRRAAHPGIYAR